MSRNLISNFLFVLLLFAQLVLPDAVQAFRDRIDLSRGVAFGTFAATGSAEQLDKIFLRLDSVVLSAEVKSKVSSVKSQLFFVVYGSMSCPDCTVVLPIIEGMKRLNPLIETLYFERDIEAREILFERTGMNRIPTVFVASPDGVLNDAAFVEFPHVVRERVESSKSDEEKRARIEAFRAGNYGKETQEELAELLISAQKQSLAD